MYLNSLVNLGQLGTTVGVYGAGGLMANTSVTLYHDRSLTLTSNFLILRGVSKFLGRRESLAYESMVAFRLREASEYPFGRIPEWGVSDDKVWFTKDPQRWRRRQAIEIIFADGRALGFSPAHASRVAEILTSQGVNRLS